MERLKDSEDWGGDGWNSFFCQKGKQWRDKDYKYLDAIFELSLLKGSLLDAGCALGDGLLFLRRKCPLVNSFAGTDVSSEAIKVCKSNGKLEGIDFFQHDILKPFTRKYDNIICLQTLEHVEDPLRAMRNLIEATDKVLILGVPYLNRRPDRNHIWSFDENDFSEVADSRCFDNKQKNMYRLLDREREGFAFRTKRLSLKQEFVNKLLRRFGRAKTL